MRYFYKTFLFFITGLLIFSCGGDGLKIFKKTFTISKSYNVDVPEYTPTNSITLSHIYDVTTEPGLNSIVDRIDKYTINKVIYSIEDYTGQQTNLEKGIIQIKSTGGDLLATTVLTNVDLQALNGAGEQEFAFPPEEINAVEDAFLNDGKVEFIISATIDNKPVAFKYTNKIDFTVEYRILD